MEKAELTALIVKAQAGDMAAMEEVLKTAHTSVSYQCRKLLRDPRDAEDMTQEVLLAVYTKLDTLKTPEAFWGWLNQTTANRCVNAIKRNHVEFQFAEDEEGHSVLDNLEELDEQQVPDKALDNTETTRMIEEIVDGLPEAQRICVMMYYYDEMSVKDIAAALGVPENTVKSRLNYARKAVKEKVLDYEKKGVKLYGLSPLPFMLFFLLRAAGESADGAKAVSTAKQVMELGASAPASALSAAAGKSAVKGTSAAGKAAAGTAASHTLGGLSVKLVVGLLAGLLAVGGVAVAAVTAARDEPDPTPPPAITETVPLETAPPATTEPTMEPTPEPTEEPVQDDLIPADRLALLNDIAYYGDPNQCRMTVNQAQAFAEVIESRMTEEAEKSESGTSEAHAALIDIGEGKPILVLAVGPDDRFDDTSGPYAFYGDLEVWQYIGRQAELFATTTVVTWLEGEGLMIRTEEGEYRQFTRPDGITISGCRTIMGIYPAEGGVLSTVPVSALMWEPSGETESGWYNELNGRPITGEDNEYQAFFQHQWDGVSLGNAYCIPYNREHNYDEEYVDLLPGPTAVEILRQCAGE